LVSYPTLGETIERKRHHGETVAHL
jgi:hypothetical protein